MKRKRNLQLALTRRKGLKRRRNRWEQARTSVKTGSAYLLRYCAVRVRVGELLSWSCFWLLTSHIPKKTTTKAASIKEFVEWIRLRQCLVEEGWSTYLISWRSKATRHIACFMHSICQYCDYITNQDGFSKNLIILLYWSIGLFFYHTNTRREVFNVYDGNQCWSRIT